MNYHTARRSAEEWISGVNKCIVAMGKSFTPMLQADAELIHPHAVAGFRMGGAALVIGVNEKDGDFFPVCTVTETVKRKHRVGVGHSHDYFAMIDGHPNYVKAVRNLIGRSNEIEQMDIDYASHKSVSVDMSRLANEELSGIRMPIGVHANRHIDGSYTIHVPTFKCDLKTARAVLKALMG